MPTEATDSERVKRLLRAGRQFGLALPQVANQRADSRLECSLGVALRWLFRTARKALWPIPTGELRPATPASLAGLAGLPPSHS